MLKPKRLKLLWYFGARTYMLEDIFNKVYELYPDKITTFVDVFGGSGTVVLNVPPEWRINRIYNDIDLRLYNLLNVLRDENKRQKLFEMLELSLPHRKIFEDFLEKTDFKDDVDMAYSYLYTHFCSYNANDKTFSIRIKEKRDFFKSQINLLKHNFFAIKNLVIECLDYKDLIKKYDSNTTFFYLDPPFLSSGGNYKYSFTIKDFQELYDILTGIKGYWLMNESEIDFSEIIKIFGEPQMIKEYVNHANTNRMQVNKNRNRYRKEGFWYNF